MTKRRSTKSALISSVLALLLCFTMLLGTTFAWFTDSVTSAGNKIVAGTLDVDLLMGTAENTYTSIADQDAAIFGANSLVAQNNPADTIWEPGKTQIVYLAVENKGNLDIKYNILLNVVDGGLIGALEYAIVDGAKYGDLDTYTDWATLKANAQNGDVEAGITVAAPNGAIKAGENAVDYFALAVHMKEEAGNQYQDKDITIDVTVLATQLASESDSFDNQYDELATYMNKNADGKWEIESVGQLIYFAQQVNSGNTYEGETVALANDIDLGGMNFTPIGNDETRFVFSGTFEGNDYTISNFTVRNSLKCGLFGVTDGAVIKDLNVENETVWSNHGGAGIIGCAKFTTVENCHVENITVTVVPRVIDTDPLTYDDGNHAGGVVALAYASNVKGCSATDVTITAYRDAGGVVGTIEGYTNNVYPDKYYAYVQECEADDITIYIDQVNGFYAVKPANAGCVVGRQAGNAEAVFIQNNTDGNVTIHQALTVSTATELKDALAAGNAVVLANDIDLTNVDWTPVGTKDAPYSGTFDGNGHTISDLTITSSARGTGLFGYVSSSDNNEAVIKNVTLENVNVSSSLKETGALIGAVLDGNVSVSGITVKSGTVTSQGFVGGVIGRVDEAASITITDCVNKATVTSECNPGCDCAGCAGGIVGYLNDSVKVVMQNNRNEGAVVSHDYAGGIVGYFSYQYNTPFESILLDSCTNSGAVSAIADDLSKGSDQYVGGILGRTNLPNNVDLTTKEVYSSIIFSNLSNSGDVKISGTKTTGAKCVGGIAGSIRLSATVLNVSGDISNSGNITSITTTSSTNGVGGLFGYLYSQSTSGNPPITTEIIKIDFTGATLSNSGALAGVGNSGSYLGKNGSTYWTIVGLENTDNQ